MEFRLPDLGEGIDTATVTAVLVKPGDSVASGQNVIAIETDKAAMEVAADVAGKIEKVLVKPGDKIAPGAAVLSVSGDGKAAAKPSHAEARWETPPAEAKPAAPPSEKRQPASPPPSSPAPAAPAAKERQADFKLPDLGEGIDSATVTSILVKPGDSISVGQNVIAIETDKASIEVPSDVAGTIEKIHVKPGDKIPPGTKILTLGGAA